MCMRSGVGPAVECLVAVLLRGCKALGSAGCLGPGEARGTRRRKGSVREPGPGSTTACVAPHLHAASQPPTPWGGQPAAIIPLSARHSSACPPSSSPGPAHQLSGATVISSFFFVLSLDVSSLPLYSTTVFSLFILGTVYLVSIKKNQKLSETLYSWNITQKITGIILFQQWTDTEIVFVLSWLHHCSFFNYFFIVVNS